MSSDTPKIEFSVVRVIGYHGKNPRTKELGTFTAINAVWAIEAARTKHGLGWCAKLVATPVKKESAEKV